MNPKTLKEIAEEFDQNFFIKDGTIPVETYVVLKDWVLKSHLEYAKSIVPEGMRDCNCDGFNSCRSEILSHLSKEEELLNQ